MHDQAGYDVCCEWGEQGVLHVASTCDVAIIVDVLSFSTCVEIAVSRGAVVYPFRGSIEAAVEFAAAEGAELAYADHSPSGYTLSPQTLLDVPRGARLVLPSPNGSVLTLLAGTTPVFAGCLRNARAVAQAAQQVGRRVAVVPAGERWRTDGSLRPSWEDWVGAGAIIAHLEGSHSPEARAAVAVFASAQAELGSLLAASGSGMELIERGRGRDVELAAQLNTGASAPIFSASAYRELRNDETGQETGHARV
jgi:2-phosphosulfolactate phosphatase